MMKKIISILLVLIWMLFIFFQSSDNGEKSQGKTDYIITKIVTTFTNIKENDKRMDNIKEKISFPIRKCAHFFEYFVLSFLIMNMFYTFKINKYTLITCAIICILYAISDEVHQLFSDGRSGQISDVLLDSSASLSQIYLFYLIFLRGRK